MPNQSHRKPQHAFALKKSVQAMSGMLLATLAAAGVHAQEPQDAPQAEQSDQLEEILVTGTQIRGTEVTGSQTIGLDAVKMDEIGYSNTNEILASIPQISNFFNQRAEVDPRASANLVVSRPNLRNMPGLNATTSSTTLVLMDGHRIAPVGVQAAIVDADVILGASLDRMDIVTDGGSSLYGADAVAGVINFMTKDSQDGVRLDIQYGSGADINSANIDFSAGTSWDTGSLFFVASHGERDGLQNKDRDWSTIGVYDEDTGELIPAGESARTECASPVRSVYGWFNYGAGWTNNPRAPGTGFKSAGDPTCDHFAESTLLPEQERNGFFMSYQQALNDDVNLGIKGYYSERKNTFFDYGLGGVAPAPLDVTGTSPGDLTQAQIDQFGLADPSTVGPGSVYDYPGGTGFSYITHPDYQQRDQEVEMSTWGVAPELTIQMGGWQLRNTLYMGRSYNENLQPLANQQRMEAAVLNGQMDPTNVADLDTAILQDILNWETKKETIHELFLARMVADGAVWELPAGEVRIAAGFEVTQDRVKTRAGTTNINSLTENDYRTASRDNTAVFGELHVPVLSSLDLSLSVRHDDYSDFGKTTNPQVGFNFHPSDWFSLYGHWGSSFNAPTTLDTLASSTGRIALQSSTQIEDADVYNEWNGQGLITVPTEGTLPGVQPQTADTWALGFEVMPLEGFTLTANYYEIDFQDLLGGLAVPTNQVRLDFPDKFIWNPTVDEWAQYLTEIENPEVFDGVIDPNDPNAALAYIYDRRVSNFGEAQMSGFDFGLNYFHDTGLGQFNYGIFGNKQLKFDLTEGGVTSDNLEFAPDLYAQGTIAWRKDSASAKITFNYTDGYSAEDANNQDEVDSFLVTNVYVGYDFGGRGDVTDGLSLRFYIDNVFDEDPPEYRFNDVNQDKIGGFTLGRMYKVGLSYTFK